MLFRICKKKKKKKKEKKNVIKKIKKKKKKKQMEQTPGFVQGKKEKNILKYYQGRSPKILISRKNI